MEAIDAHGGACNGTRTIGPSIAHETEMAAAPATNPARQGQINKTATSTGRLAGSFPDNDPPRVRHHDSPTLQRRAHERVTRRSATR